MTDYLLQMGRAAYRPHLDLVAPIHRAYAERHGLTYRVVTDHAPADDWGGWDKVPEMLRLTADADTGWVLWLDADTLIVGDADPRETMGDRLVGMTRHPGRTTPTTLNCGVLFVKACPETHAWLQAVWDGRPGVYPWYEQDLMNELLDAPERDGWLRELDHRWNSTVCLGHPADCIIRAWHGGGSPASRLTAMRAEIERRGL